MLDDFPARKRIARIIPWGYKISAHDPNWIEPVLIEVQIFYKALDYLRTCSYIEVAKWMTVKSGRSITDVGLAKVVKKIKLNRARRYETTRRVKKRKLNIVERRLPTQA